MLIIDNHIIRCLQGCQVLSWLSGLGSPIFRISTMKIRKWIIVKIANAKDVLNIPILPACYVIYIQKNIHTKYNLIYIGSSTANIQARIQYHIRKVKRGRSPHHYPKTDTLYFNSKTSVLHKLNTKGCVYKVKYKLSCKLGEELMREYRLIKRLKPIYNKRSNSKFIRKSQEEIKEKEEMAYPWYCCKRD